jgi:hypothetical protein
MSFSKYGFFSMFRLSPFFSELLYSLSKLKGAMSRYAQFVVFILTSSVVNKTLNYHLNTPLRFNISKHSDMIRVILDSKLIKMKSKFLF